MSSPCFVTREAHGHGGRLVRRPRTTVADAAPGKLLGPAPDRSSVGVLWLWCVCMCHFFFCLFVSSISCHVYRHWTPVPFPCNLDISVLKMVEPT